MQDRFKFKIYNKLKKCFIDENEIFLRGNGEFVIIDKEFNRTWIKNNPNYKKLFCTGLKDKNGKLIYEGDIVKGEYLGVIKFGEYQGNFTHYIKWQRKYADLLRGDINYWIEYPEKSIKVIGNIYENEELLNGNNT